jgi:hypothetical protein
MSALVQDNTDKQVNDAQPRVNDPRRQDESRRLEEEVIEAAQRLERDSRPSSQAATQPSRPRTEVGFQLAEVRPMREKSSPQERAEKFWASFNPERMPSPPLETMRLPGLGLIAGLAGAFGLAAAVALIVTNFVQIPTTSAAVSGKAEAESSQPVSTAILQKLPEIEGAQANMQPVEPPPASTGPLLAATETTIVAVAAPSAAAPPPSLEVETSQPDVRTPPANVAAEPNAAASLAPDKVASLLKRGQDLIAAGDVAGGRVMLAYLADSGAAEASFILAGTFDAAVLAKLGVVGVQPDPAKARAWYARAAEQGSSAAMQHLRQSALR